MSAVTSDQQLQVYVLGPFRLIRNGQEILRSEWTSKKALTAFQYLVAHRGEKVPKDILIELLWPEFELDESLSHNLHSTIYLLRRVVEPKTGRDSRPEYIFSDSGLYWIERTAPIWVDVEEFDALLKEAAAVEEGDPGRALELYEKALLLYRGDFIPEEIYTDWTAEIREHYRELYLETAVKTSYLTVQCKGDHTQAVKICRAALKKDAYREDVHMALIHHLVQAGRYSEAVAQYKQCEKMLQEEFGLDPSPEMRALLHLGNGSSSDSGGAAATTEVIRPSGHTGAFFCDRETFGSIYQLERRRQLRTEDPMVLITIAFDASESLESRKERLIEVVSESIRRGDVACQWDRFRVGIMLARAGHDTARIVCRRLRQRLSSSGITALVSYEVLCSSEEPSLLELPA